MRVRLRGEGLWRLRAFWLRGRIWRKADVGCFWESERRKLHADCRGPTSTLTRLTRARMRLRPVAIRKAKLSSGTVRPSRRFVPRGRGSRVRKNAAASTLPIPELQVDTPSPERGSG